MKKKKILNLDEFGSAIGLKDIDKKIIREKNRMIDYLKVQRLKKGMSQAELARLLGTKQPSIARMEAGFVGEVSFDFIIKVAIALGVRMEVIPAKMAA